MIIQSYHNFKNSNSYHSRNVIYNLSIHGYRLVKEFDLDIGEKSMDAVKELVEANKEHYTDFVYYRTTDLWRLPYMMLFGKSKISQGFLEEGKC
jgi:hypothetical protein